MNKNYIVYKTLGDYDEQDKLFQTVESAVKSLMDYHTSIASYCAKNPTSQVYGVYFENGEQKQDGIDISGFLEKTSPTQEQIEETTKEFSASLDADIARNERYLETGKTFNVTGCGTFIFVTKENKAEVLQNWVNRWIEENSWRWKSLT